MQEVIAHPGTVAEALIAAPSRAAVPLLEEVILPSQTLSAPDRIGIYHGMYLLRMTEALASDYPGLRHFLGEQRFSDLVRDYVQAYPSRSYSLNRLGDDLPDFLRGAASVPRRGFCCELARLERAVSEVFDAPQSAPLGEARIASLAPEEWERVRLQPIAALRLLALRYPANGYMQSLHDNDHDHPRPRLKPEWVAVFRRNYSVCRRELRRDAHDLLADIVAGTPIGRAVRAAARRSGTRGVDEGEVSRWFREWVGSGFFQSLTVE